MSDLNVSMRLALEYQDRDARRAEKDLKDLAKAADRLNGRGTDKLERDLEQVSRNAAKAGDKLQIPADKIKQLNSLKTDNVEGELNALKGAAAKLGGKLDAPARKLRELNRLNTDKAEKELKELGQAAAQASKRLGGINKTKFGRLNAEIDKSHTKIERLGKRINSHVGVGAPANKLGGTMNFLAGHATSAFTAVAAFASVDNIIRGLNQLEASFNKLDDAAARVAVTAELLDPAAVEKIKQNNDKIALHYGRKPDDVNAARDVYAAANYKIDRQNKLLDPTVKAANASGAEPEIMAKAVLSGMNSLGLKEDEIPAFLDQLVKGGKEGEFEIEAMAKYFPELGALYSASGRTGLDASAELIALSQITRKGSGMEASTATNLQNFLSKMAAPETVKNFKDKGVDLRKLAASAKASGTPYVLALLDEVERLTGGDEFEIGELFGDMQAKSALRPLLANRELYQQTYDAVRNKSAGVVDKDEQFLSDRPQAKNDRRDAGWAQVGRWLGENYGKAVNPALDEALGWVNPDWRRMEEGRAETKRLKGLNTEGLEADITELKARIDARPDPKFGLPDIGRQTLELRLRDLEDQLQRAKDAQGATETPAADFPAEQLPPGVGIPKPKPGTGKQSALEPTENGRRLAMGGRVEIEPDLTGVAGRLEPAGAEAGAKFAAALETEAVRVGALADELKARFSFTATPSITPQFSATPTSASPGQRSTAPAGTTVINQRVNGQENPERIARATLRKQNRAIRSARSLSLHDTGAFV